MKRFLLSVVIPVHRIDDRVSQIEHIVKLILGLPIQLVVVQDNQFFDFNIFEEVKGLDSEQISVVSGKFGNPGAARNFGLRCTTGDWTAFWDSDDSPCVSEFLKMVNYAETKNASVVAGFFNETNKEIITKSLHLKFPAIFLRLQILLNPGLWRFAFKTDSIDSIKFPELVMAEDLLFLMKRIQKVSDICLYPGLVYRYLTNSPNQVTRQSSNRIRIGEALEYIFNNRPPKTGFFFRFLTIKLAFSNFKFSPSLTALIFIVKSLAIKAKRA